MNNTYQLPPEPIRQIIDAPRTPNILINSAAKWMLILKTPNHPPIEEVAAPMLRIGGLRINPANNATANRQSYTDISVRFLADGHEEQIQNLPQNPRLNHIVVSPDETKIAFTHSRADGVELWMADLQTFRACKITEHFLIDIWSRPFAWHPDSSRIFAQLVPQNRGAAPAEPIAPKGPVIQETGGHKSQVRTYQDLLKDEYDVALLDYYLTAQITEIDVNKSTFIEKNWNTPAIYRGLSFSPNGRYLLTHTVQKPYSYVFPIDRFPYQVQIWDDAANLIKDLYDAPLADDIPIDFDAVRRGPRRYSWRSDRAATLYWAEAQDDGNPANDVEYRDFIYTLAAPFENAPSLLTKSTLRFADISWGDEEVAILQERWWKTRTERRTWINPQSGTAEKVLLERSFEDSYTSPGAFVLTKNEYNRAALLLSEKDGDKSTFTIGLGASPEGNRPFLARWNLESNEREMLFHSQAPYYESPVYFNKDNLLIFRRESTDVAPNFYQTHLPSYDATPITQFPDPYPTFRGVSRQQLSYKRKDGLTLTATLYLPPNYTNADGKLPLLMWAYPREFKSSTAAGRVKGSPYQFAHLNWKLPTLWALRGYAVLDQTDMPIVGEGDAKPNDTFVEQLRQNAQAAIDCVVEMGVADPQRVAVGGHSYGAFMTANLLAHTDLFAAGIARSGAYNRSLTPFGFQNEERTYWEAPEIYYEMSPFSYADKIQTPLLLIHGDADNNAGTFPMQSERLYSALKGAGAVARLVMLPHESHGYLARESVMHVLWEQDQWLEKFVKNR